MLDLRDNAFNMTKTLKKHRKRLRGVISKNRVKQDMVIIGDTADPNSAPCIHMIH